MGVCASAPAPAVAPTADGTVSEATRPSAVGNGGGSTDGARACTCGGCPMRWRTQLAPLETLHKLVRERMEAPADFAFASERERHAANMATAKQIAGMHFCAIAREPTPCLCRQQQLEAAERMYGYICRAEFAVKTPPAFTARLMASQGEYRRR